MKDSSIQVCPEDWEDCLISSPNEAISFEIDIPKQEAYEAAKIEFQQDDLSLQYLQLDNNLQLILIN